VNKAQQVRIATALAGFATPPRGSTMARQSDAKPRHDRIHSSDIAPHGKPPRVDLVTTSQLARRPADGPRRDLVTTDQLARAAKARKASVSIRGSGGGASAVISNEKHSLRDTIRSAFDR